MATDSNTAAPAVAGCSSQRGEPGHETTFSSTKSVLRSVRSCATVSCVAPSVERPLTDSIMSPLLQFIVTQRYGLCGAVYLCQSVAIILDYLLMPLTVTSY